MALGWLDRLFVKTLKSALEAPKVNPIPRTGEDGKAVDCYSVYVSDEAGSYLAERVEGRRLIANQWNEQKRTHDIERELDLNELRKLSFEIIHYHGLVTHTYNTKGKFLRSELTKFYKVVSLYVLSKHAVPKFIHSKKPLKKPDRIKILETIDKMTEDSPLKELTSTSVSNELYGMWSIVNSKREARNNRVQRILESLVESGELRAKDSFTFLAKGKLLVTLEHLKEEKARQDRAESNAVWMRRLTVILVITALFQSGLVRTTHFSSIDWLMQYLLEQINLVKEWVKAIG
ncbi:hypothetical protein [Photobacterium leiognathi]|uniref:hypothetical protein n=1 Tax=Photobacterium leiognathi TaxID=553611 RepID=UPI0029812C24|nr:hypothetical protein [Photobacterium leiognathi]